MFLMPRIAVGKQHSVVLAPSTTPLLKAPTKQGCLG